MADIGRLSDEELVRQSHLRSIPDDQLKSMKPSKRRSPLQAVGEQAVEANKTKDFEPYAQRMGGKATDLVTGLGLPPEMAGGVGAATYTGIRVLPDVLAGGVGGTVGSAAKIPLRAIAAGAMHSALKPKGVKSIENAKEIVDGMFREGVNVTEGGVEKLRGMLNDLNDQAKAMVAGSSAKVPSSVIDKPMGETLDKFIHQGSDWKKDASTIRKAWNDFKKNPLISQGEVSVQDAQSMKQGIYKKLADEYGSLGSAGIESQKSQARGLREGISKAVPDLVPVNERESQILKVLDPLEKRVLAQMNHDPGGWAWLTHNPKAFVAYMASKSSPFKSIAARILNPTGNTSRNIGAGAGVSLYELGRQIQDADQ